MRILLQLLSFLAALSATAPAAAELYKWVDERGVTNYSNEAPPAAATTKKLTRVENTISVYTPDESFMQAVKAMRERSLKVMAEPEPPRSPVARIAVQPQSGYEQCLASGRLGCEELFGSYFPAYLPAAAVFPLHGVRATRFLAPRPVAHAARVSRGNPR